MKKNSSILLALVLQFCIISPQACSMKFIQKIFKNIQLLLTKESRNYETYNSYRYENKQHISSRKKRSFDDCDSSKSSKNKLVKIDIHDEKKTTPMIFQQIPALDQQDGWRCGYFSTFHLIQMIKIFEKKGIEELGHAKFNTKRYRKNYNTWQEKVKQLPSLIKKFDEKKFLAAENISSLLTYSLQQSQKDAWQDNITIFDAQIMNLEIMPLHNLDLLKNINSLRSDNIPQGLIVVNDRHWTSFIIFPEGLLYGTDSLYKLKNAGYVQNIFDLFINLSMPTVAQTKAAIRALKQALSSHEVNLEAFSEKQKTYLIEKYLGKKKKR